MTKEEAIKNQTDIVRRGYKLSHWYGTNCRKCCGVYPKLMSYGSAAAADCYYQCEVCGKRTEPAVMPWISEEAWNRGEFVEETYQLTIF